MNRWGLAVALHAALAVSACAFVARGEAPALNEPLSGRIAVRIEAHDTQAARSETAGFELSGEAQAGQLKLSTPLGSTLAQSRWSPDSVVLATPQGERRFVDLDALTRELLGESVPVAALFDWLRGRPWLGAPSTKTAAPAEPGFVQLGWTVSLAGFSKGWVVARRDGAPAVTVRVKLDR